MLNLFKNQTAAQVHISTFYCSYGTALIIIGKNQSF